VGFRIVSGLIERAANLVARLLQIRVELLTRFFGFDFNVVRRRFGVMLRLIGGLMRLLILSGCAGAKSQREREYESWSHT
jgi:hypothetical protein